SPLAKPLVNNDGSHGPWARGGTVSIPVAGLYPIAITYFEEWNSQTMDMFWTGPGFARSIVPDSVFLDTNIAGPDNLAPSIPKNLKMVGAGASFVDVDWDNSADNVGVTGYDVYVDNVKKYTSAISNATINYLSPGSTHAIKVKAVDSAGNASAFSSEITVKTSDTTVSGLKYRFYQGTWGKLPNYDTLTPVKSGTTPNVDINIRPAGIDDDFAFIWQGHIHITTPGTYTFETISDDGSKLYFNTFYSAGAIALINSDGLHANQSITGEVKIPAAGYYPISITYFDRNGGEIMEVYWTGPGITRQKIPSSAFIETASVNSPLPTVPANLRSLNTGNTFVELDWDNSTSNSGITAYDMYVNGAKKYTSVESGITADSLLPNTKYTFTVKAIDALNNVSAASNEVTVTTQDRSNGLKYRYYEGDWNVLPNFNTLTPLKSGTSANVDIVTPRSKNDTFGFVWEGYINIPRAGTYTFETMSDDGSKLYFNSFYSPGDTALINSDGSHAFQSVAASIAIPAPGLYPIAITYFDKYYDEAMQVYWTGPEIPRQLIPNSAFTSPEADVTSPAAPANLKALYKSRTYVNLDWDNALDNVGIASYDIYVNGVKKYTTHESAITADKLLSNTPYTFTVKAIDFGGNTSEASAPVSSTTTTTVTGLNYRYYEGNWDSLPNFNALTPVKSGASSNIDISVRTPGVNDYFAFVWEGYFNFQSTGNYTFELISDDGSKLYFNSFYSPMATPVINNDGLHGVTSVSATVNITATGLYPMSAVFFEKYGGEVMELYLSGPGIPRQRIPNAAFINLNPATPTRNESVGSLNTASATIDVSGETAGVKVLKAYPNPVSEWLNVDFYVEIPKSDIGVDVVDINGKMVFSNSFKGLLSGNNTLKMNVGNSKFAPGVYFVKVNVNGIPSKVIKLVKSRK
ncbi:MAG: PA14 domain-containing protein, partial [Chitinophagaceae bacterium]